MMPTAAVNLALRTPSRDRSAPVRRAFTMLEVIVVCIIMAIMAGLIVPRLSGLANRRFDLVATGTADAMLMFAQRDLAASSPVGFQMLSGPDGETRLALMTLGVPGDAGERASDDAEWRIDPFVRPVVFPIEVDGSSFEFLVDDESLDIENQPFSHVPGDRRPRIEIAFRSRDGGRQARLTLEPYAIGPTVRIGSQIRSESNSRQPVDLDNTGRSREDW
ncbi:MAG: type II secretion system protein [Phycisphaerales bacterium]